MNTAIEKRNGSLKIIVHDYAGHPFQVQLSRELARRGNQVIHCYDSALSTPHGALQRSDDDPDRFSVEPLTTGSALDKHALAKRWLQERRYGEVLGRFIRAQAPDIVISANTPLGAQATALKATQAAGGRFIFWVQDLYGIGIERALRRRLPLVGGAIGAHFIRVEHKLLASSDAVVTICRDFNQSITAAGVASERVEVVENWAPIEEFDRLQAGAGWMERAGLEGKFVYLYAGTLGLKHNPSLLANLARRFADDPEVAVVVVSEGTGADWLTAVKAAEGLTTLHVFGFQEYASLPGMLGEADVLVAILEPEASEFSVPSKVLSYMCAGRPILAAIPATNLAARTIVKAGAGLVSDPRDELAFGDLAARLRGDAALRVACGKGARLHAEHHFTIESIANRFEAIIRNSSRRATHPQALTELPERIERRRAA